MNILHVKYAVEVAKTKSISQAAENLYTTQPNLSRAIKDLEESLGVNIFKRTTKGITVTPDGEEFLLYARSIISQLEDLEGIYRDKKHHKQRFSVCVPRASYIASAMAELAGYIDMNSPAEIYYKETDSITAVNSVVNEDSNLAIIRFEEGLSKYFKNLFTEKKLVAETITEFSYVLIMSKDNPLREKEGIYLKDLADYIEIVQSEPNISSLPRIQDKATELFQYVDKRIFVCERASQFELLQKHPHTFMWVSPVPQELLDKYSLVQRTCEDNNKVYKDLLVYRKKYKLTDLDNKFITAVCESKRKYIK